jgi:hypothetical protein
MPSTQIRGYLTDPELTEALNSYQKDTGAGDSQTVNNALRALLEEEGYLND